jgi:hypothetical protein
MSAAAEEYKMLQIGTGFKQFTLLLAHHNRLSYPFVNNTMKIEDKPTIDNGFLERAILNALQRSIYTNRVDEVYHRFRAVNLERVMLVNGHNGSVSLCCCGRTTMGRMMNINGMVLRPDKNDIYLESRFVDVDEEYQYNIGKALTNITSNLDFNFCCCCIDMTHELYKTPHSDIDDVLFTGYTSVGVLHLVYNSDLEKTSTPRPLLPLMTSEPTPFDKFTISDNLFEWKLHKFHIPLAIPSKVSKFVFDTYKFNSAYKILKGVKIGPLYHKLRGSADDELLHKNKNKNIFQIILSFIKFIIIIFTVLILINNKFKAIFIISFVISFVMFVFLRGDCDSITKQLSKEIAAVGGSTEYDFMIHTLPLLDFCKVNTTVCNPREWFQKITLEDFNKEPLVKPYNDKIVACQTNTFVKTGLLSDLRNGDKSEIFRIILPSKFKTNSKSQNIYTLGFSREEFGYERLHCENTPENIATLNNTILFCNTFPKEALPDILINGFIMSPNKDRTMGLGVYGGSNAGKTLAYNDLSKEKGTVAITIVFSCDVGHMACALPLSTNVIGFPWTSFDEELMQRYALEYGPERKSVGQILEEIIGPTVKVGDKNIMVIPNTIKKAIEINEAHRVDPKKMGELEWLFMNSPFIGVYGRETSNNNRMIKEQFQDDKIIISGFYAFSNLGGPFNEYCFKTFTNLQPLYLVASVLT